MEHIEEYIRTGKSGSLSVIGKSVRRIGTLVCGNLAKQQLRRGRSTTESTTLKYIETLTTLELPHCIPFRVCKKQSWGHRVYRVFNSVETPLLRAGRGKTCGDPQYRRSKFKDFLPVTLKSETTHPIFRSNTSLFVDIEDVEVKDSLGSTILRSLPKKLESGTIRLSMRLEGLSMQ
mmetsp:Transcript_25883/g.62355  ORF Transcript_25883/g.62355 Transcript_25883/m.62355 type:complete len:176 (-) Transcript_25883:123-650(-)